MKKLFILLTLFVGFYLLGHFAIRWKNKQAVIVTTTEKLVDCEPNNVRRIKITQTENDKETVLSFDRVDPRDPSLPVVAQMSRAEWRLTAPSSAEADSTLLSRFSSLLCQTYNPVKLAAKDFVISEAKDRRAKRVEFELYGEENKTRILSFGLVSPDRLNIVEYTNGTEKSVAKIPTTILQTSSLSPQAFVNLRVMKMSADNIQTATVYMDGKENFSVERAGSEWRVLKNGKALGPGSEEAGKYLNRLATLRGLNVLESDFSPEKCEKEKNNIRVEFSGVANRRETLYFSAQKNKQISSCSNARSAKFQIHQDLLKYIYTPVEKLIATRRVESPQL